MAKSNVALENDGCGYFYTLPAGGERLSAFLPYKSEVTILTNVQRGNTKSSTATATITDKLSIFQLAAKGDLRTFHINEGKNLNKCDRDSNGLTPLMWASAFFHTHTVKLLLQAGASVDFQNSDGQTALHFAAHFGCCDIVKLLLAQGADFMKTDMSGNDALLFAVLGNQPQTVSLLLCIGACTSRANKNGKAAYQLALQRKYTEVLHVLETHMKYILMGGSNRI